MMNLPTDKGRAEIRQALAAVQRGCTARTLTLERIEEVLQGVEDEIRVSKAALKGTQVWYTGAEQFPNAYRYSPQSTHFRAEYNGRGWVVTDIVRGTCPNRRSNTSVTLSDSAKDAVLARLQNMEA